MAARVSASAASRGEARLGDLGVRVALEGGAPPDEHPLAARGAVGELGDLRGLGARDLRAHVRRDGGELDAAALRAPARRARIERRARGRLALARLGQLDNRALREWLGNNRGRTAYFVLEHSRLANLRNLMRDTDLEELTDARLCNKFVLVRGRIGGRGPTREEP